MSIALLIFAGIAMVAAGAGVTFALAAGLPQDMLQRAQDNGRFAGLTADDQSGGTGTRVTAGPRNLGNQPINAI